MKVFGLYRVDSTVLSVLSYEVMCHNGPFFCVFIQIIKMINQKNKKINILIANNSLHRVIECKHRLNYNKL